MLCPDFRKLPRQLGASVLVLGIALGPVGAYASTEQCDSKLDDLKALLSAKDGNAGDVMASVQSAFAKATSASYSDDYFDDLDDMNDGVSEARDLVNEYYDLDGYLEEMALGEMQDHLPPVVTRTMDNAIAMAEVAGESSKLDIAELRCSQNVEDAALGAALDKIGGDAKDTYLAAQSTVCKVVHVLADLQQKKDQLDELRETGYPLFYLHSKDKKDFSGKKRTVQFKVDLRIYPEYPDDAGVTFHVNDADQTFLLGQIDGMKISYNTSFKWSDKDWGNINLYQYLLDDPSDMACVPLIKVTNNAKASLCVGIKDINSSANTLKLATEAEFKYNDKKRTIKLPTVTVHLPYTYLADVSDMKENAMEDLKKDIVDELVDVIADQVDIDELAESWSDECT